VLASSAGIAAPSDLTTPKLSCINLYVNSIYNSELKTKVDLNPTPAALAQPPGLVANKLIKLFVDVELNLIASRIYSINSVSCSSILNVIVGAVLIEVVKGNPVIPVLE
jgi:hypothetical protein